jgi:hypothetical protein
LEALLKDEHLFISMKNEVEDELLKLIVRWVRIISDFQWMLSCDGA